MMRFNDKPGQANQFQHTWLELMSQETRRLIDNVAIMKTDFYLCKLNIPVLVMIFSCAEVAICQLKFPRNAAAN
jgi:hypothetical protein